MATVHAVGAVVEFNNSGTMFTQVHYSNSAHSLVETSVSGNETPSELVDNITADVISDASGLGHTLAPEHLTITQFRRAG